MLGNHLQSGLALLRNVAVIFTDLPDDSRDEHFCCVHSPDLSTHTHTRESDDPEETPDANSQSQPEPAAQAGSDITESEHGAIRRRTRQCY